VLLVELGEQLLDPFQSEALADPRFAQADPPRL
jgi:hypothetical protein